MHPAEGRCCLTCVKLTKGYLEGAKPDVYTCTYFNPKTRIYVLNPEEMTAIEVNQKLRSLGMNCDQYSDVPPRRRRKR
jgi:hypothetical protein